MQCSGTLSNRKPSRSIAYWPAAYWPHLPQPTQPCSGNPNTRRPQPCPATAQAMATPVYYFVPEDGDSEDTPNVFLAAASRGSGELPTLGDIKAQWPLPGGYYFRFKRAFKNTYVWQDALDDAAEAPVYEGAVFAKVSRLRPATGAQNGQTQQAAFRGTSAGVPAANAASLPATHKPKRAAPQAPAAAAAAEADEVDLFSAADAMPSTAPAPVPVRARASAPASTASHSDDLLGLSAAPGAPGAPSGAGGSDMFAADFSSMGAPSPSPPPGSSSGLHSFGNMQWPSGSTPGMGGGGGGSSSGGGVGMASQKPMAASSVPSRPMSAASNKSNTSRLTTELGADAARDFQL